MRVPRRTFLGGVGAAAAAAAAVAPFAARAQARPPVVGDLSNRPQETDLFSPRVLPGMADAGYLEDRDFILEARVTDGYAAEGGGGHGCGGKSRRRQEGSQS